MPIKLDENPDAIALKSAMAILQIQARNAERDMRELMAIKERALKDPMGFAKALANGKVVTKGDKLFQPSRDDDDGDDEVNDENDNDKDDNDESEVIDMDAMDVDSRQPKDEPWGSLPTPQNVVRAPPINWQKYGVVGDSLDKLHEDQKKRPTEGKPQIIGPDGKLKFGGDGVRRTHEGIAAPYTPGKDKIEKGRKKGRK